jgi:hypothetical protein
MKPDVAGSEALDEDVEPPGSLPSVHDLVVVIG